MDHEKANGVTQEIWTRYIILIEGSGALPELNGARVPGIVLSGPVRHGNSGCIIAE